MSDALTESDGGFSLALPLRLGNFVGLCRLYIPAHCY